MRTHATVRAPGKGEVRLSRTVEIDVGWAGKDVRIVVAGGQNAGHAVAFLHLHATEFVVLSQPTTGERNAENAQQLLDDVIDVLWAVDDFPPAIGIFCQPYKDIVQACEHGVEAGDEQKEHEAED